jgi:thiol-disulfide isomerase/thioredoxin
MRRALLLFAAGVCLQGASAADWVNSAPLTLAQLRGKVVLVEFWAFACVNCRESKAWVESAAEKDAGAGLVVVAVHTPELAQEKPASNVRDAVARLGIRYPAQPVLARLLRHRPGWAPAWEGYRGNALRAVRCTRGGRPHRPAAGAEVISKKLILK